MGKKKKSVSQVVIAQSDTSDDPKPETDTKLEETKLEKNENTTTEISITTENAPSTEETCQIHTTKKEQLNEDTPILSNTEDAVEPKPENDKKEQEDESKTVETTTSENSVELKEIQIKPNEDEPIKNTKTNCSKGWCMIL